MTTKADEKAAEKAETKAAAAAEAEQPKRVVRKVEPKLAKPVYLLHDGKFSVKVPALTREVIDHDEKSDTFGQVIIEELEPEQTVSGTLPKGSRFGSRKIGVAHEVWRQSEVDALLKRGFRTATGAEVKAGVTADKSKSIDAIAERDRETARKKLERMTGRMGRVVDQEEE